MYMCKSINNLYPANVLALPGGREPRIGCPQTTDPPEQRGGWLRTNGVNTNGAAAKVMNSDGLGKKVRPGTFGNIQVG